MRFLVAFESIAVVALIVAIVAVVMVQVISRYILNASAPWTEEVAQVALVWLVFLGAALVSAHDGHVTIRVLGGPLGYRGRRFLAGFAYVVVIASGITLIWIGFDPTMARLRLPLPATHWPAGIVYVGVLLGFALIVFHSAVHLWDLVRGRYVEAAEDIEEAIV